MKKEQLYKKDIVIFGAGKYGRAIFRGLNDEYQCNVIAYIDNKKSSKSSGGQYGVDIKKPDELINFSFDYILLAAESPSVISEMKRQLKNLGIDEKKIIDLFCEPEFIELSIDQRKLYICGLGRYMEENEIKGAVAECGVADGNCAKFINYAFPDRRLYLFDSFEGFKEEELREEIKYSKDLGGTPLERNPFKKEYDMERLMKKMTNPKNVIIKKGFFPESTVGVEDRFCFVNLDMDLYIPMYEALCFFWERMERGGVILLHDYYHPYLEGVKRAVNDFESKIGYNIYRTPIGDSCSIALIK